MGRFVNSKVSAFQDMINLEFYVDKTGVLAYTNRVIDTSSKFICNSRPRRFGKSITADMITAYYSKGCSSESMFSGLAISKSKDFKKHLNQYDVIHLDIQWCMEPAGGSKGVVSYITENTIKELKEYYAEEMPDMVVSLPDALSCIHAASGKKFIVVIDAGNLAPFIGFTEEEVKDLCARYGRDFEMVKHWYDGYVLEEYQIYNPKAVVSAMTRTGKLKSYWTETGTYEAIVPLINMDFDGLKTAIIAMLAGASVEVEVSSFQNDMTSFTNRDDVLTCLIHLGYLV